MSGLTFVLGGARSGKSELALRLATASARPVVFVATAEAGDDEMAQRIDGHRAERPAAWRTIEEPLRLAEALRGARLDPAAYVVVDCLTLWVSNLLHASLDVESAVAALLDWQRETGIAGCVVSNEVGLGLVPATPMGRDYRDALGRANRAVAGAAERTLLVVAGLALDLRAAGARPLAAYGALPETPPP